MAFRTSEIEVVLPTLHVDQVRAYSVIRSNRFVALRCGRRWGKTALDTTIAANSAIKRQYIGWFSPAYKFVAEAYRDLESILDPVKKSASKDGVFLTTTGGRIDFWSLENELAGRSRKYHGVVIDEGAFTKSTMLDVWRKNIRPTLLDYGGWALVTSNTNGVDAENFLWQICNQPEHGFVEYHAPTHANPYLPADELAKLQAENAPLVYQQEYLAEFVDWSGVAFFSRDKLLCDAQPVAFPVQCDAVLVVIDTATKTGRDNDGTASLYVAYTQHPKFGDAPLVLLDWDIQQIEGALLESWMPNVFRRGEELAAQCGARLGFVGAWIEDKSSGMVLLQQAARRGWPARPIESKLTSVGKSERAISVSGYHHQEKIKISRPAFDKTTIYKGTTRNHLLSQVTGFRIGVKDQVDDDLLDTYCYSIALTLGNVEGF